MSTILAAWRHSTRRSGTATVAAALLVVGASVVGCATPPSGTPQVDGRLAAGWEASARPLFLRGPGPSAGTTAWLVPATLPAGTYEVISRRGGNVKVVDGHRFTVDNRPYKDLVLILSTGDTGVEAVDSRFVSATAAR
ncbi:hypothetical protein [Ideonella sp.]|uniref:hypothetical protein n=1 Tax=Ideonella sp. TaxID=1929293 RepID=UPI0035B023AB